MPEKILLLYGIIPEAIQPYGSGLINDTWKVIHSSQDYILQKINQEVFKNPPQIADNIQAIANWLEKEHPEYFFVAPVRTVNGDTLIHIPAEGYFRLFPFVKNSEAYDVVQTAQQAFEAARQFGSFTGMLSDFPVETLKTTLPDFHNLAYRYLQFEHAIQHGNALRRSEAETLIHFLVSNGHIVDTYQKILSNKDFKLRVTHHDTKISNVLFDKNGKGLCVIDLDTVMPGYFISDVGDMMRTYLSPVSEEEKDLSKIDIRVDYFQAIVRGYLEQMLTELSHEELRYFVYAGIFMTYMQSIRFLTDHLNNDSYYGASYEGHNYIRAKNQITLLQRILEKENVLKTMVTEISGTLIAKKK